MTSFTKGAEAMREMAAKVCDNMAEERGASWGGDARMLGSAIRALPLPSQTEDSSARDVVVPSMAGEPGYILKNAAAPQQNAAQKDQSAERNST